MNFFNNIDQLKNSLYYSIYDPNTLPEGPIKNFNQDLVKRILKEASPEKYFDFSRVSKEWRSISRSMIPHDLLKRVLSGYITRELPVNLDFYKEWGTLIKDPKFHFHLSKNYPQGEYLKKLPKEIKDFQFTKEFMNLEHPDANKTLAGFQK